MSSSESSPPWSDLTPLVLERIRDLLDSNLYDVRLRSISPADDPCNGWLLRSLDATPNTFTFLSILCPERVTCRPGTFRDSLDLLQYRISEVCKCFRVDDVEELFIRKVLLLTNFVENIDFTVLLVFDSGEMYYFNDGDSVWTTIEVKHYKFEDMILFKGICYAVDEKGLLVSLDSAFHLNVVLPPPDHILNYAKLMFLNLVVFESDLFLVSVLSNSTCSEYPEKVHVFKWIFDCWNIVKKLENFNILSSPDVSVGVSANDFLKCKDSRVYFLYPLFNLPYFDEGNNKIKPYDYDAYDVVKDKSLTHKMKRRQANMFWPPPTWMLPSEPLRSSKLGQLARKDTDTWESALLEL